MFCANCGNSMEEGTVFCTNCGNRVGGGQGQFANQPSMGGNQAYQNQQPQYGSPQGQPYQGKQSSGYIGPLQLTYDQVPFYRRRWFVVLIWLLFSPILIFIAFSGDIYALRNGSVYKEKRPYIWGILGIIGTIFLILINTGVIVF